MVLSLLSFNEHFSENIQAQENFEKIETLRRKGKQWDYFFRNGFPLENNNTLKLRERERDVPVASLSRLHVSQL